MRHFRSFLAWEKTKSELLLNHALRVGSFAFPPKLPVNDLPRAMSKKQFLQQLSIEDATTDYDDEHYQAFTYLVFEGLLSHIRNIPFEQIIQDTLQGVSIDYQILRANSLSWLYTMNRKVINERVIYSFRFCNASHPDLYQECATRTHPLFKTIDQQRHGRPGWCQYMGQGLLSEIDQYLNIQRVVQSAHPHTTKLFIHQRDERLDIEFNLSSPRERITITFEPGYPAVNN